MLPYDVLARVYELQHAYFLDDLALYLRLARAIAPEATILELGCGSGRLLLPLAESGYRVVGVDESTEMLRIAERKLRASQHIPAERWTLIHADMRGLRLDDQRNFDLAFIALNTFLHNLCREDQLATLRAARRHLRVGGLLIVDLPPNDEMAHQPDDGTFQLEATLIDPQTRSEIHKYVASRIFWATQEQELTYRIEERHAGGELLSEQLVTLRLRHVFRHEMELLLMMSGFAEPAWYGDYEMNPYGEGSPRMIALAQAVE
ncbi:MAG: class I SAM-dependent methyltransferase [Chloroflexi bacterium]|jgi:SAM-dependent methyltransferase|nr:class I SAM-dependent methyltransferase [Chloroflexota bacterium]